ncbi:transcriptional regulator [Azospirillum sp. RWY-5-1]|uniref:Transcriptional regulator n=1 Tax=Azospirillum oleiclasticum TaxID=2735135 RepID=A0ABX2TBK9_9PROT|nr:transcriptional regulator [Azospirillum oleiclasticum]NYZ14191.1 transcriptional regulator [Azospirillum oleiclasticum]NYZ21675.1 transcriptional regulator [Azospirillum oleiclasticum]
MITAEQIRAARGLLSWTQHDFADRALLSVNTIRCIEKGSADTLVRSASQVPADLEAAGVEFSMRGDPWGAGAQGGTVD